MCIITKPFITLNIYIQKTIETLGVIFISAAIHICNDNKIQT